MKRLILSASRLVVVACLLLLALGSNAFGDIFVPAGLNPGDKYHLAFVSSTSRDATSSDIGVYNSFVQAAADAAGIGVSEGVFWKAIASTPTVCASDNALVSAPVYRMNGQQLATGFNDLWGSPLNASLSLDENGQSITSIVWTGTDPDGCQASHPLGIADPINTGFTAPGELVLWIKNGEHHAPTISYPLYALSSELTVPEAVGDLDLKPGACPNTFNRNGNGLLPVALVGTDGFDVMDVDLSSVLLFRADGVGGVVAPNEGPPGPHSVFADVATPFDGELCDCHELEGDGILDLSMKFKTQATVNELELDSLPPGDLVELCVSGMTLDGEEFEACDCIRLVPPGTPPGMLAIESNMPNAFIDVTPMDNQLDGGGFGSFQRTYPLGTFVTLTAPSSYWGIPFAGWQVNDKNISVIGLPLVQSLSIDLFVIDDEHAVKAIYRNRKKSFDAEGQQQQQLEN